MIVSARRWDGTEDTDASSSRRFSTSVDANSVSKGDQEMSHYRPVAHPCCKDYLHVLKAKTTAGLDPERFDSFRITDDAF
jgi:hypothetical protein